MCVYTCVCVCVCVCVCACVHACVHACMCVHVCALNSLSRQDFTLHKTSTTTIIIIITAQHSCSFAVHSAATVFSPCCCCSPSPKSLPSSSIGAADILHPSRFECLTACPLRSWHIQTWPQTSCEPHRAHQPDAEPEPRRTSEPWGNHGSDQHLREPAKWFRIFFFLNGKQPGRWHRK